MGGVFAHEPVMARAPTGEYVMYFTSDFANKTHGACNCCNGNNACDGSTGHSDCSSDSGLHVRDTSPSWMSWANRPEGPWSTPQQLFPDYVGSDTNFAPVIFSNGSLLAIW